MATINKVILLGNVGREPEILMFDVIKKATFSLATSDYKLQSDEKNINTQWHTIVCWRNLADVVENFVHKGTQLLIEGKISYKKWTDKQGCTHTETEIIASNIQLITPNSQRKLPKEQTLSDILLTEEYRKSPNMSVFLNNNEEHFSSFNDLPL
ncbi:MAG: single-stranded DNA-binding protein [Bacteroidales bacterium]|jgi:single-strand DNA-binding protein|nr:single-stranded DNA-binding protein [Bacteroidales bacterium]